jgi:hypothetical protein
MRCKASRLLNALCGVITTFLRLRGTWLESSKRSFAADSLLAYGIFAVKRSVGNDDVALATSRQIDVVEAG